VSAAEAARPEWALLVDGARSGEENMARDIALAEDVAAGRRPPTLRLYAWDPPAVSIGHHQDPAVACDLAACAAAGWDVVRRPTGGRAVLHASDEVTYAVALPASLAPPGVLEAYAWLAGGLVAGYRLLGVPAELSAGRRLETRTGACFDAAASAELVVAGRKITGSAQVRRAGYLLQHGSLPRTFDPALHVRLLGLDPRAGPLLARRAAGLADVLRPLPPRAAVEAALRAGFEQALGIRFANRGRLSDGGDGGARGAGDPRPQPGAAGAAGARGVWADDAGGDRRRPGGPGAGVGPGCHRPPV
jgi:lipoate-protein ligase A